MQEIQIGDLAAQSKTIDHRQQTLDNINNSKLGWAHIKGALVCGIGFYTDAYDLFVVSLAVQMIGFVYFPNQGNKVPLDLEKGIKVAAIIGVIIGDLVFGYLSDVLGRKKMYGSELVIIISTTVISCFAADTPSGMTVCGMLIFWRFLLGIGIGGDYPVSAIMTAELANTKNRGQMMALVKCMQGLGILSGSVVSVIVIEIFQKGIQSDEEAKYIDIVWRIVILVGALPGFAAMYFRLAIPESPRYTIEVEGNIQKAICDTNKLYKNQDVQQVYSYTQQTKSDDSNMKNGQNILPSESSPQIIKGKKVNWTEFFEYLSHWNNLKQLIGTSVAWFCMDISFYGTNLNTPVIIAALNFSKATTYDQLFYSAIGQMIIGVLGTVPGYWFTVFFIESWGRKTIQQMGFVMNIFIFSVLGIWFHDIKDYSSTLFIIIYAFSQFFQTFGPNATCFIIPGELFPTRFRATCHGIAAAFGKVGAIVSLLGFISLKDRGGPGAFIPQLFIIVAVFMFIGVLATSLIPETKGKSLEELNGEDKTKVYITVPTIV